MAAKRVVFIRAVNVGGAKLPMGELRALAEDLGATEVSTYIASGNLLCTPKGGPAAFDRALEKAIQDKYGYFREVISRTPAELQAVLDAHPFEVAEDRFSYVYFLTGRPTVKAVKAFEAAEHTDAEAYLWIARERYRLVRRHMWNDEIVAELRDRAPRKHKPAT